MSIPCSNDGAKIAWGMCRGLNGSGSRESSEYESMDENRGMMSKKMIKRKIGALVDHLLHHSIIRRLDN